jgi:hypothetical protein
MTASVSRVLPRETSANLKSNEKAVHSLEVIFRPAVRTDGRDSVRQSKPDNAEGRIA